MLLLYERFTPMKIKSRAGLWHVLHTQGTVFSLSLYHQKKKREKTFLIKISGLIHKKIQTTHLNFTKTTIIFWYMYILNITHDILT